MDPQMLHDSQLFLKQHGAQIVAHGSRMCLVYPTGVQRRKRTRDLECSDPIAAAIEASEWLRVFIAREESGGRFDKAKSN